jgi:phage terminase small subunit
MAKHAPRGPLTERERRFVEAYMGQAAGNGTEAAKLAGYKGTAKVLAVQGTRLLSKANVQAAIDERAASDPQIADRTARQRLWSDIAFGRGPYNEAALKDRLKASELLGKSQADFVERHEHAGAVVMTWQQ